MNEERIKKILRNYTSAIYYAKLDRILSLWAIDGELSSPVTHSILGKKAIEKYYSSQFNYVQDICKWVIYFLPENFAVNGNSAIVNGTMKDVSTTFYGGVLKENIIIPGKFMMLYLKGPDSQWKIKQFNWNYQKLGNTLYAEEIMLKKYRNLNADKVLNS